MFTTNSGCLSLQIQRKNICYVICIDCTDEAALKFLTD